MAGVTIPPTSISLVFLPRSELRALAQVPRIQQRFWPRQSRASCSWTRYNPTHQSRPVSRARDLRGYQLGRVGLFSTSNPRQLEGQDGNKHQSKGSPSIPQNSESPPSPTAKLTSALKSKLAPLRHENIYTIPNILTLSRLIATPAIGYLIIHNHHLYAFSLFAYAGFSDLLDGWIARRWNLQTVVGSVVDPMADKILMTTLVTCLAINGSLPLPLATLMIGRDASLAIAALYYRYASLPAPKTMARYWDFSLPSAEVHPTTISKFNTFLQLSLLGTLLCTNLLHDPSAITSAAGGFLLSIQEILGGEEGVRNMVKGMSAVVASTTMYSGLEYVWKKDAVKILGKDEELKKRQGRNGRMIIGSAFGAFIVLAAWLWSREGAKADEKDEKN